MSSSMYRHIQKIPLLLDKSTQCSERDIVIHHLCDLNSNNVKFSTYGTKKTRAEEVWKNVTLDEESAKIAKGKEAIKDVATFALKTAAVSGAVLGGIALAVPLLGFGAAGVTAGSLAAAYQSAFLGGTIASGSAFATLQSVGAAGLAASTKFGIIAGSGAVVAATSGKKKNEQQSKSETCERKFKAAAYERIEKDVEIKSGFKNASTQTIENTTF